MNIGIILSLLGRAFLLFLLAALTLIFGSLSFLAFLILGWSRFRRSLRFLLLRKLINFFLQIFIFSVFVLVVIIPSPGVTVAVEVDTVAAYQVDRTLALEERQLGVARDQQVNHLLTVPTSLHCTYGNNDVGVVEAFSF